MDTSDTDADILALSHRLSRPSLDMSDQTFHLDVYNSARHIAHRHPNPSAAPPLRIILYAIRNILQPSFLLDQIPDLLVLIVHLEILRSAIVEKAQLILRRPQSFHRNNLPAGPLLANQHRSSLLSFTSSSQLSAIRIIYRKIIHGCCLLHIYHLWSNYDPRQHNAPCPLPYLIEYFPAFAQRDQAVYSDCQAALTNCPWHYNLSQDELRQNDHVGQKAAEFLVAASQYLDDPDQYCLQNGYPVGQPFDTLFPPPSQDDTAGAITKYMGAVSQAAAALEAILNDSED